MEIINPLEDDECKTFVQYLEILKARAHVYKITPTTKPRMTQRDKWKKRKCVLQFFDFRDKVKELKIKVPESHYHVIFIIPMPKSWSKKKKKAMNCKPHQQIPDKDNLEKALLDSIYESDAHVWDGRVTKLWGNEGLIIVD